MAAADAFLTMVHDGPFADIFRALQAKEIFATIGEHAGKINASSFQPVFATLQSYASDSFVLAVTRLLDRERNQYQLQSTHGVLKFLKAHIEEIPLKEPVFVRQAGMRLGYRIDSFEENPTAIVDVLMDRLPHPDENLALNQLKALRDKRIAHPERISAESLPAPTWESAMTLLKIPTEALAVSGAYTSTGFVDNQGRLLIDSDAKRAAFATLRLLREIDIAPGRALDG